MKAFWDATGQLWSKGALRGKTVGLFQSTATLAGGQETAALTFLPTAVHHGMVFVPAGYVDPAMFDLSEVHGGSPWGPGTLAGGDGSRQPSEAEKKVAAAYGAYFGTTTAALVSGKAAALAAKAT
jgi:NAD(P)H dehydrogenase (quinone)